MTVRITGSYVRTVTNKGYTYEARAELRGNQMEWKATVRDEHDIRGEISVGFDAARKFTQQTMEQELRAWVEDSIEKLIGVDP